MKKVGLLLLALLPVSPRTFSQTTSRTIPAPAQAASAPVRAITLNNSVVALDGIWKFHPGDSPWVNGAPQWAQLGYDDAWWAPMDLTPKAGAVDLQLGTTGFVPGWTRKGYPGLSGFAWYRLRVRVTNPGQPLWLKMPNSFDDAYQLYANGQFVGQFGNFGPHHVAIYIDQPRSFALPATPPDGQIEIALRFYLSAVTRFTSPDAGGMHAPPMLGLATTVRMIQMSGNDVLLRTQLGSLLQVLVYLLVAPLVLWAWLYSQRERTWLWLFLGIVMTIASVVLSMLLSGSTLLSVGFCYFWLNILGAFGLPLMVMFWWEWFGLRGARWIPRTAWLLSVVVLLSSFCAQSAPLMGLNFLSPSALRWLNAATTLGQAVALLLVVVIVVKGFRRDRTEALLVASPIALQLFGTFSVYLLTTFHIPDVFFPFGLGITFDNALSILGILLIGALALRRFVRTQVREGVTRKALALDLEQAQQLQQKVLVPEAVASKYFAVEAEYRPAQQVGGDFFQTLTAPDGTLLVVIGDVSGKGVSASMLVAVLVGAIRNQAQSTFDPAAMLAALNRQLLGRSGGNFATCLAVEIGADGTMRVANAGHLRPYLNGKELDIEGSLPLGMDEAAYTTQNFTLEPGDRLTLMTDGVVEATNVAKQMFGFERAREISQAGAASIAAAAQSFGQEDDITVVGVEFAGVVATA